MLNLLKFGGLLLAAPAVASPSLVLASVLLSLVVIYLASRLGGELCTRIHLPPVLGELVSGVLVGASGLHWLVFPTDHTTANESQIMQLLQLSVHLSPEQLQATFLASSQVIAVLAELGVVILLFEIGLASDVIQLLQVGPQAAGVAVVGVTVPFLLGTGGLILGFGIPTLPAIFTGAALTATSIGITAKVLAELRRLDTPEGQIIVGAAVLDDVLGIIVLAVVGGLIHSGRIDGGKVAVLMASATVFLVGGLVAGRALSGFFVSLVNYLQTRGQLLVAALVFVFALSYVGVVIQLEAILGAFVAGLILAETEKADELKAQVAPIADMLVPVFFVVVGARTDVSVLNPFVASNREGLLLAAFLVGVAGLGKLVTGLTVVHRPDLNGLAIGVGMIPRGEVGLVFVAYGNTSGVLSPALQAALIVMVILTTFMAPPLLRLAFEKGDPPGVAMLER
jgi:Kef-type K+ transport system membrane component KefB